MKNSPFSQFELTDDITKVRGLLVPNILMLKDADFAFEIFLAISEQLEKTSNFSNELFDFAQFIMVENGQWVQKVDDLIEHIQNNKWKINFYFVLLAELLYGIAPDVESNEIFDRLLKKINRRAITSNKNETSSFLDGEPTTSVDYNYLFMLTLRQISLFDISKFLAYHLSEYNNGFLDHLVINMDDYGDLLTEKSRRAINKWIEKERDMERGMKDANIVQNNPINHRIEWMGTQKELGELFVELHKKGWISETNHNQITQAFTKSNTISQVLKPSFDRKTSEKLYEQIYTSYYKPKFDSIRTKDSKK
jgi:hypothetical protein